MAVEPIENSTWLKIEKLIPSEVGPRGVSNRHVLGAAIYVLVENCGWLSLDVEQWGVHGSTVWRRIRRWQDHGIWDQIADILIADLTGINENAKTRSRTGRRGEYGLRNWRGQKKREHV